MKSLNLIRTVLVSAFVCAAAAGCGSVRGTGLASSAGGPGNAAASSAVAAPRWLTAAQLPDAAQLSWAAVQRPAAVPRSRILEAVSTTNFPTAPTACRLQSAAIEGSAQDESDLFEQARLPDGLLGSTPGQEGAAQFLLSYGSAGAAEQAAAQIITSIEACAKSLSQSTGTNDGARGRLSDPAGAALGLAAQLGQAEPQCIDVYVLARCTKVLARPLAAGVALESDAVVTTQLPGDGSMMGGYVQIDAVYLVQRGDFVSMLFSDAPLGWGTRAAEPTPVLQAMADDLTGTPGQ
jgi:hypothetical protein